ncbi:MAG: asparagine synthetase B [Candidatus Muirbacterium halophilum]|nr:asparagine synthetase B [Candidatus Muirbacterium halophilum]MCK9475092.1 asparagine synthetase B [Candidatus Muirbacterium halophilum]
MTILKIKFIILMFSILIVINAKPYLIYMDNVQNDHLKAYGVVYTLVEKGFEISWLLNYRGGSFLIEGDNSVKDIIMKSKVSFDELSIEDVVKIESILEESNCSKESISVPSKIAVYTPDTSNPWDDAVTMALEYAEIPYDKVYDDEILAGKLADYDWLHLHHEDFTGQMGKFYASYGTADWYKEKYKIEKARAFKYGFKSVPELKKNIALIIRDYVEKGGFLFAMCASTDTLDIALATLNTDICAPEIDETPIDPDYKEKLDFKTCFAFENFEIITNPYIYEFSNIDIEVKNAYSSIKTFRLFEFAAKFDRTAAILTQNHTRIIKDFLGQTTAFNKKTVKSDVLVLGFLNDNQVKYIHGIRGKGTFTFLGGHDPEDYAHLVGEKETKLELHKNSPGYRLILNNILFPSVKKNKLKT